MIESQKPKVVSWAANKNREEQQTHWCRPQNAKLLPSLVGNNVYKLNHKLLSHQRNHLCSVRRCLSFTQVCVNKQKNVGFYCRCQPQESGHYRVSYRLEKSYWLAKIPPKTSNKTEYRTTRVMREQDRATQETTKSEEKRLKYTGVD